MTSKNLIVNAALLMSEFKKKQIKNPIVANAVHQYKQMKAEEESAKLNKPSVSNPVVARALEDFKAKVRNGEIAPIVENWAKKGTPEWDKHVDHMREVTGNPNWGEGTKTGDKPSEGKKEENKEGAQKEEKKEISAEEKKESPEERNKDTDNKGEGKKPTERDLGSKVRNTANGIESVTSDNFSMGINTGDKEKDIDEAYKRAEESQEEFKDAVKSVGSQMNMEECKWENGHPVINGPCFMNRTTLKGRDRVNEKLAENEAECKKNPKKKSIGINAIVDINGSTLVLGENDSFKTALEKIKDSGFEVVRVKNCFNGEAYDNTGYGDIKVNVRTKNGFVGEIIIADKYTTEQKMNGAGHGLYEVTRSLSRAIELAKPEVIEDAKAVRKIADEMSRLVYLKPGEDHSKFGERFEKVKSMCDKMQKIVDENPQYFEKKIIDGMPKLLNKIKDPTTYDGYREELKRRGL